MQGEVLRDVPSNTWKKTMEKRSSGKVAKFDDDKSSTV